ncbi:hypothetical protein [Cognatishimia sp. F0-27]|uniref:hypothetical protein n=1 Tax=Cognatishimia sp. F0-27 TaxID=2816855 RepID=UPI001D0C5992|nr:hypothetical protein [Cognatishimia sp. F0-27]MCC1494758.1 hypothetical protein [Cognatishimia sp. F0-27]
MTFQIQTPAPASPIAAAGLAVRDVFAGLAYGMRVLSTYRATRARRTLTASHLRDIGLTPGEAARVTIRDYPTQYHH